ALRRGGGALLDGVHARSSLMGGIGTISAYDVLPRIDVRHGHRCAHLHRGLTGPRGFCIAVQTPWAGVRRQGPAAALRPTRVRSTDPLALRLRRIPWPPSRTGSHRTEIGRAHV